MGGEVTLAIIVVGVFLMVCLMGGTAQVIAAIKDWKYSAQLKASNESYVKCEEYGCKYVRDEAIRKGLAYYHPQTAQFTWNEPQPKPEVVIPVATKKVTKK
jgi:hypothetical protein